MKQPLQIECDRTLHDAKNPNKSKTFPIRSFLIRLASRPVWLPVTTFATTPVVCDRRCRRRFARIENRKFCKIAFFPFGHGDSNWITRDLFVKFQNRNRCCALNCRFTANALVHVECQQPNPTGIYKTKTILWLNNDGRCVYCFFFSRSTSTLPTLICFVRWCCCRRLRCCSWIKWTLFGAKVCACVLRVCVGTALLTNTLNRSLQHSHDLIGPINVTNIFVCCFFPTILLSSLEFVSVYRFIDDMIIDGMAQVMCGRKWKCEMPRLMNGEF